MKALQGRKIVAQGKRNEMSAALGSRSTKYSFSHRMGEGGRRPDEGEGAAAKFLTADYADEHGFFNAKTRSQIQMCPSKQ